jgi:hypothetical protein
MLAEDRKSKAPGPDGLIYDVPQRRRMTEDILSPQLLASGAKPPSLEMSSHLDVSP